MGADFLTAVGADADLLYFSQCNDAYILRLALWVDAAFFNAVSVGAAHIL